MFLLVKIVSSDCPKCGFTLVRVKYEIGESPEKIEKIRVFVWCKNSRCRKAWYEDEKGNVLKDSEV